MENGHDGEVVGGDLDAEVVADDADVFGYGDAPGRVAEAAGAVLRDEVGGDEDREGMRQKVVWIVRGVVVEACLLADELYDAADEEEENNGNEGGTLEAEEVHGGGSPFSGGGRGSSNDGVL